MSSAQETQIKPTAALLANQQDEAVTIYTCPCVSSIEQACVVSPRHHPSVGAFAQTSVLVLATTPLGRKLMWHREVRHMNAAYPKIQIVWPFHVHLP